MRISCEFCGAEYEVDEARIPAEGLPIKCARCLAVFVAQAPAQAAAPAAPPPQQTANWGGAPADPWANPASGDPWAAPAVAPNAAWQSPAPSNWSDPNAAWSAPGSTQAWQSPAVDPWAPPPGAPPPSTPSWGPAPTGPAEQDPFAPPMPSGADANRWPPTAPPSLDPALERMLAEESSSVGPTPDADPTRLSPSPWGAPAAGPATQNIAGPETLPAVVPHAPAVRPAEVAGLPGGAQMGDVGAAGTLGAAGGLDYYDLFGREGDRGGGSAVEQVFYAVRRADGSLVGQYDQITVRAHLQIGRLSRGDEASTDGGMSWRALSAYPEFSDLTVVAPAPGSYGPPSGGVASELARIEQSPARPMGADVVASGGAVAVGGSGGMASGAGGAPSMPGGGPDGLAARGSVSMDYLRSGGLSSQGSGGLQGFGGSGELGSSHSSDLGDVPYGAVAPVFGSSLAAPGAAGAEGGLVPQEKEKKSAAERPSWLAPAVNTAEGRASLESRRAERKRRVIMMSSLGALAAAAVGVWLVWDPSFEGEEKIVTKIQLDPATISRYRAQSRTLLQVGSYRAYAEARGKLLSVVRSDPKDFSTKALYLQALLYLVRDYGQAAVAKEVERVRKELGKSGDNSVEFRKAKISYSLWKKDYVDAIRNLDLLLTANPDDKEARYLHGLALSTPKDSAQAVKVFDQLLTAEPKSAKYLRGKAEALLLTNRDAGMAVLRDLVTAAPTNAGGALRLAELYAQQGRREDAKRLFAWLINPQTPAKREASPDEGARAHTFLAQLALEERELEAARGYLELALKVASSDDERVRALVTLGEVLTELRDYKGAIARLEQAQQKQKDSPEVLARLAIALAFDGQSKRARVASTSAQKALLARKVEELSAQERLDHFGAVARAKLSSAIVNELDEIPRLGEAIDDFRAAIENAARTAPEAGNRLALVARVRLGSLLRSQRNLAGAQAELAEALRLDPKSPQVHNGLGDVLRDQKQGDKAEASYRKAIELDGRYHGARFNLATLLSDRGRTKEALDLMEELMKLDPKHPGLNLAMAVAYQRQKRAKEAILAFERAIKANPEDARVYLSIGKAYFEFGGEESFKKARDYLDKAIEKNRSLNEAYFWRGRVLMELGKPEIALDDYKIASEREADNGRYRIYYGAAFEKMGSYRDAFFQYTRAIEELRKQRNEVDIALALYKRGRLRLDRDEVPAALLDLEEALKYEPRNVEVLVLLGDSLAQSRKHGAAVVRYRAALEGGRKLKGLWFKLGKSLLEVNQRPEALKAMTNAAAEDPSDCYPHYYLGYLYKDQKNEGLAVRSLKRFLSLCQKPPETKDVLRDIADMEGRKR